MFALRSAGIPVFVRNMRASHSCNAESGGGGAGASADLGDRDNGDHGCGGGGGGGGGGSGDCGCHGGGNGRFCGLALSAETDWGLSDPRGNGAGAA